MRHTARLCASLPLFVVACAPKGETTINDSAAAVATTPVTDPGAARQAIDQANAKLSDALQRGDTAAMMAHYDNEAVVMMSGMPAWRGRADISKSGGEFLQTVKLSDVKFNTTSVDVAGDYAIETGTYEMTVTPKGAKPIPDKGKYVTVWKRQADGTWKVYRDVSNTDLPPK